MELSKHDKVARPEFEEHDLSSSAKKVLMAPICPAIRGKRNKKPTVISTTAAVELRQDKTYRLTCITNCYIAISSENSIVADNTDILLLAGSVNHICLDKYPGWAWLSVSGNAQLVELL